MRQRQVCTRIRRQVGRLAAVALVGASAMGCATATASPPERPTNSTASPSVAALPTAPSATSVTTRSNGAWTGLSWSTPSNFPDATFIDDIVAWNGKLIAAGEIQSGANQDAAVWDSSDGGTTWTRLDNNPTTFADSRIQGILTTTSGLVAWGSVGEPVCTGQGEGMACGPFPIMLWTSPDGAAWKRIVDVSVFKDATIAGVIISAQGLLAVGNAGWDKPAIWVSGTGDAWERQALPSATFKGANLTGVRATTSGYLLAGGIGNSAPTSGGVILPDAGVAAVWWSPDGRTWTKGIVNRADGIGSSLGDIYVGAGGMVAIGSASGAKTATAWSSSDGKVWQPIANAQTYGGVPTPAPGVPSIPSFTIIDDGTHLLAVDDQTVVAVWISSDGRAWQQIAVSGSADSIPRSGAHGQLISGIFQVPGGLIMVGQQGSSSQIEIWRATASS